MARASAALEPSTAGTSRGFAIAVLLAASAGCRQQSLPAPDVIARIERSGGDSKPTTTAVRYSEFERYLRENSSGGGELGSEVLPALFDRFLDERLLARAAADQELVAPGTPARDAMAALLASAAPLEPPAADIAAYYREHPAEFTRPERVRLRQVFTTDRASAERAAAELREGRSFARVARSYSRDPAAERGGDQGELARGDLPPGIAEVVFKLRPGEISPVIDAEYGFHIFQVVERLPAAVLSPEEAAPEARKAVLRAREDRHLAALVADLRSRYNVEIYAYNLPFPYQGPYRADPARR